MTLQWRQQRWAVSVTAWVTAFGVPLGTRRARVAVGRPVSIGELTRLAETAAAPSLYHKNLQPVTYVTADLAGRNESPVYVTAQMNQAIEAIALPEGYSLEIFDAVQPFDTSRYAMKWDGEWHVTIEVFRDLGLAFAVVLVLIYLLIVGWFQSFSTPVLILVSDDGGSPPCGCARPPVGRVGVGPFSLLEVFHGHS